MTNAQIKEALQTGKSLSFNSNQYGQNTGVNLGINTMTGSYVFKGEDNRRFTISFCEKIGKYFIYDGMVDTRVTSVREVI